MENNKELMENILDNCRSQVLESGFSILSNIYTESEIQDLINSIEKISKRDELNQNKKEFYAHRFLISKIPEIAPTIFTSKLSQIINKVFGENYFNIKSIYFDKPALSNWAVPWHQDLTISVTEKVVVEKFINWTLKENVQYVQPDLPYLENIFTIRIHLDDCDYSNGALKVISKSHRSGILSSDKIQMIGKQETICNVKKGGVMIMKPLLLHASSKSISDRNRRVIHLEFSSMELPNGLKWKEYFSF